MHLARFCRLLVWGLLLALPACVATVTPPPPVFLKAAGASSAGPLFATLANAYQAEHPQVTLQWEGGGSEQGYRQVAGGQVEFGLVSWPPEALAADLRLVPVGRDALAIIVHPRNPVSGLSLEQLRALFNGRELNWLAFGGPDLEIQVISREAGSGTRAAFEAQVMAGQQVTPTAIVLPHSQAVVDFVAIHPEAIAYVSAAFVTEAVRAVPLEGIPPTLDTLTNNSYPLRRELAFIVHQPLRPEVNDFLEFALSPAGQQLIGQRWGRVR